MLLRETSTALLGLFLVAGVLLRVAAAPVRAQTAVYDDFNAPQINPDKRLGVQPQFGGQGDLEPRSDRGRGQWCRSDHSESGSPL